jgi:hypothetical protein
LGGIGFRDNPRQVHLADLGLRVGERFLYEYVFTDDWQHDVRVARILPLDPRRLYPVCIGGRRAVPPEARAARSIRLRNSATTAGALLQPIAAVIPARLGHPLPAWHIQPNGRARIVEPVATTVAHVCPARCTPH